MSDIASALYWIAAGIFFHVGTINKNYYWGITGMCMIILALLEKFK